MLNVAISLLFGFAAFAAVTQIHIAVAQGLNRRRAIVAELSRRPRKVRAKAERLPPLRLAAAAPWHNA